MKSVISLHIKSAKHAAGVERLKSKSAREKNISDLLKKYDEEVHPVGEGLPEDVHIYLIKVLALLGCFLKAGVPLNKVDHFRDIKVHTG